MYPECNSNKDRYDAPDAHLERRRRIRSIHVADCDEHSDGVPQAEGDQHQGRFTDVSPWFAGQVRYGDVPLDCREIDLLL